MPLSNATQITGLELHASLNYAPRFEKAPRQVVVDPQPAADDAEVGPLAPCRFLDGKAVPALDCSWPWQLAPALLGRLQAAVQPDKA